MRRITRESIKFIRSTLGMDQSELAINSGLSTATIKAIERGRRNLTSAAETKITRGFDISDELMDEILELYVHIRYEISQNR